MLPRKNRLISVAFVLIPLLLLARFYSAPMSPPIGVKIPQLLPPPGSSFFGVTADPSVLRLAQGGTASSNLTVASFQNFTGTVTLSLTTIVTGLNANLSSSVIALGRGEVKLVGLAVGSAKDLDPGIYEVTLDAKSGLISQRLTVQVIVNGQPGPTAAYITPQNLTDLTAPPGSSFTVSVNLSNAPHINSFQVIIYYNNSVLHASSLDFSQTVLGPSARVFVYCIDKTAPSPYTCNGQDRFSRLGEIAFGMVLLSSWTPNITQATLFQIHFNVTAIGLGQVHLYSVDLGIEHVVDNVGSPLGVLSAPSLYDGYFTNLPCANGKACQPPTVSVSYSPNPVPENSLATFNVTVLEPILGVKILSYLWDWPDGLGQQLQTNSTIPSLGQPMTHQFLSNRFGLDTACVMYGLCLVTLTVYNSRGVSWEVNVPVQILVHPLETLEVHASPDSLSLQSGVTGTISVTILLYGLPSTGEVAATTTSLVSGVSLQASLSTITVSTGDTTPPGQYAVIVAGTNGTIVDTAVVQLTVVGPPADFTITASPPVSTTVTGSPAHVDVSVGRVNWFNGNVVLSTSTHPSAGLACTLAPSIVNIGGSPSSTVTCVSSVASLYIVTLTGTLGSTSHNASVTIRVTLQTQIVECGKDKICAIESNVTISQLTFAGDTIHLEAARPTGAFGQINVTIPKLSVPHIDELHVFVDNNKLPNSALTITSNSTAYFIYFTFTFHSPVVIDIQLTQSQPSHGATILGLDPMILYEIIGAVIAVALTISGVLILRKRRRTTLDA